ncbi:hypothetical protein BDQ12DRAFT_294001 [Crucibulum laeve]|uniref:Uncharacterized protein n=1 Tax=Crucibulum laeve TaxID=68775 RepID=A0A5C3MBU9_9AGAR|nr:hypothetical protein BDQ12DRAFT_294001 [Crucibulum laeve]
MSAPPIPTSSSSARPKLINVKLEELENPHVLNGFADDASSSSPLLTKPLPKRTRAPRKVVQKEPEENRKDTKEKRGKKRKEREDELPEPGKSDEISTKERTAPGPRIIEDKVEREKRKALRTPTRPGHRSSNVYSTPASSATPANPSSSTTIPATPSLKIRLPRLSSVNIHNAAHAIPAGDTPSRL